MATRRKLIKISNDLNGMRLTGFSGNDQDILMALFWYAQGRGTEPIHLTFGEIKSICKLRHESTDKTIERLQRIGDLLLGCRIRRETPDNIYIANIFTEFMISKNDLSFTYAVSKSWEHLFNNLLGNFTIFDLLVLVRLKRKHSKTLYRTFCQYRRKDGTGVWRVPIETNEKSLGIKQLFEIPEYAQDRNGNIKYDKQGSPIPFPNKRILDDYINPAIEELKREKAFSDIRVTPKKAAKRGAPIEGYEFEFMFPLLDADRRLGESLVSWISSLTGLDERSATIIAEKAKKNDRDEEFIKRAYSIAKVSAKDLGKLMSYFMDNGIPEQKVIESDTNNKSGKKDDKKRTKEKKQGTDYNALVMAEILEELEDNVEPDPPKDDLEIVEEDNPDNGIPGQYAFEASIK